MTTSQGMQLQLKLISIMLLIVVVMVMVLLSSAAASAAAPTRADLKNRGCKERCGNVDVSYPFGVNEKCGLNSHFLINCSDSKPYLAQRHAPVSNISLEGELRVMTRVRRYCYNGSGINESFGFHLPAFSISNSKNKFTAIGCDTHVTAKVFFFEQNVTAKVYGDNYSVATGCESQCSSIDYIPDGPCSGIGCCQTSIPKGTAFFNISVQSYNNVKNANVSKFNPCSYAFAVEEGAFNFSTSYLHNFTEEHPPIVLDWAVEFNGTCEEAKRNQTSYACGDNSDCYDSKNGLGYLCKCLNGYKGNPYLSDGCQDINECADPNLNQCVDGSKCDNKPPGKYTCSCPKGYRGDGRKDGTRCINDQFRVISIVAGLSSGIGALFLIIATYWLFKVQKKRNNKKRKEKFFERNGGLLLQQQLSSSDGSVQKPKLFNSKELEKATDYYNEDRILGQGGQGTVYKGMLSDGRIVAIKKSKIVDEGNVEQFINEVVILSQIIHRNVVKLLGCCLETEVPLVVYEFISNGTLFELIHDPNEDFPLSWEIRLRIAIEVAEALSYLHYAASVPIYHRDIKSTNILLDDKYRAKVSDFGTSKSVAIDQTHFTTRVQGTYGYLDPEYFQSSQFTEKSDVYSFGVVIVELLTGLKPISSNKSQETKSLATFFLQSMEDDRLFEIIDQKIMKEDWREEIVVVAQLAKRCLNLNGKKRPTMKDVTVELEGIRMSRQNTTTQQNYEVFDYNKIDFTEAWDVASTSTGTCFDSTIVSSFNDKP